MADDAMSTDTKPTKYTPGPWRVDKTKALGAYGVWTEYGTHIGDGGRDYPSEICSVYRGNQSDFPREVRDANASLIAAAPDLLAACKLVMEWGARMAETKRPMPSELIMPLKTAIASAEGETLPTRSAN